MKNKNIFSEKRLAFFAEVQKLAESEIKGVKEKMEKEGPELDTKGLVDQANSEIDKYTAQLNEMPADFNKLLHDEIVKYFLTSAGRHEKDEKSGLSAKEFGEYRAAMIARTKELLAEYAPTEEDLQKKKEADKKAKETQKAAENVKPLDMKAIKEDPGEIPDLQTLNTRFDEYNDWNASLQKGGVDILTLSQSVAKSYAGYKENRDGVGAYKKFKGYLFPEDDQQRIDMQNSVTAAQQKVAEALKNFAEAKVKLKKYGDGLSRASDGQKQSQVAERQKALDEIDQHSKDTEETKKTREEQYKKLNANQKSLEDERNKLSEHQKNISRGKEAVANKEQDAKNKRESLTQFDTSVKAAIGRIDDALLNKDLSPEETQQLQETKKQLQEKSGEVGAGLKATNEILAGTPEATSTLTNEEKAAAERSLNIKSHLEGQVVPTLTALDSSIKTLEGAKLKFATTKEEVNQHFDTIFKMYDAVDDSVDNAVLKNNLANEQIGDQLTRMEKSLASMDTKPPSGLSGAAEASVGIPLSMIGGGLSKTGHFFLDQATWLSNTLASSKEDWTKTTMGTVGYWTARVGVEVISSTIGVAGGLVELGAGIFTMAAHPVETAKGLGTLIGLNPEVSASRAWAEMGKAIISLEDFKAGRIGVGIGKIFVNVVTTVTGAGAVGAAGKAGKGAYLAARVAGKGVTRAIAEAGVEGTIAAGKFVGKEVGEGVKNLGKNIKSAKTVVASAREMGVSGVAKRVFTKEGRANARLQKLAGKEAFMEKSVAESHYLSIFSEDIPDTMKKDGHVSGKTGAWIDEGGKIHYNGRYFESRYGVKMTQVEGRNVFVVSGVEMSPMKFFKTKEGRAVLKEMEMLKDHEVTHRLLEAAENISGGKLGNDILAAFERSPNIKETFMHRGIEMNQRNIQEFLCEIADGRVILKPHEIEELESVIGKHIRVAPGSEAYGFSFEKVRNIDTKKLKVTSPEEMIRSSEDAFTSRDHVLDSVAYRNSYEDFTLLVKKRPDIRNSPRELRKLLGDTEYEKATEYMRAQDRLNRKKFAQSHFEISRSAMEEAFERIPFADRTFVEKAKEAIHSALTRGEYDALTLFKSKSKIYSKYQREFSLLEEFYKSNLNLQMLDRIESLSSESPNLHKLLLQNSEHLTPAKLSVIQMYPGDLTDIMAIIHHDNPKLLNMLARDTHGVLTEYSELIIHSPGILDATFTTEKAAFLEANLGNPAFSRELAERILKGSPEKVTIHGVEFHYFADSGKPVGEGGMGVFHRVALIEPGTNTIRFAGVKVTKPGVSLASEAKGSQHVMGVIEAEAASGNTAAAEAFARPIGVSADGKMIFYDVVDYQGPNGFRGTQDLEKYIEDPAASPDVVFRGLYNGGEGLAYLHQHDLIHGDFKSAQIFRTDTGGRLGDFGTLTTNTEYVAGIKNKCGGFDFGGTTEPIYLGTVPYALSPYYYSGEVSDVVRLRGPQYAWKVDAYAFGSEIEGTITGHVTAKKAVLFPDGTWHPHPTDHVSIYVNPPHPPKNPESVAKLTEIYRKLKDPNNLTYTVADALRDMKPYIH